MFDESSYENYNKINNSKILIEMTYENYVKLTNILQSYYEHKMKARERARSTKGTSGDPRKCRNTLPEFKIIDSSNLPV